MAAYEGLIIAIDNLNEEIRKNCYDHLVYIIRKNIKKECLEILGYKTILATHGKKAIFELIELRKELGRNPKKKNY
ncbi:MAG: hypothetical protein HFE04_01910 [Bacilli bacterium]|nr:hypothetical protein [Bacilli bacterium]